MSLNSFVMYTGTMMMFPRGPWVPVKMLRLWCRGGQGWCRVGVGGFWGSPKVFAEAKSYEKTNVG